MSVPAPRPPGSATAARAPSPLRRRFATVSQTTVPADALDALDAGLRTALYAPGQAPHRVVPPAVEAALAHLRDLGRAAGDPIPAALGEADVALAALDPSRARRAVAALPPGPEVDLRLGSAALLEGDPDAALAASDRACRTAGEAVLSVRARLLRAAARLSGAPDPAAWRAALVDAAAALKGARAAGRPELEADALTLTGRCLVELRDYPRARATHETARAAHEALGQGAGLLASTGGLGLALLGLHETARAAMYLFQASVLARELADLHAEAAWRIQLDHVLHLLDRTETRVRELDRTVEVAHLLGDEPWRITLLANQAEAALSVRDRPRSRALWLEVAQAHEARGEAEGEAFALLRAVDATHPRTGASSTSPAPPAEHSEDHDALTRVLAIGTPSQIDTARRLLDGRAFLPRPAGG